LLHLVAVSQRRTVMQNVVTLRKRYFWTYYYDYRQKDQVVDSLFSIENKDCLYIYILL